MSDTVPIECSSCDVNVMAEIIAKREYFGFEEIEPFCVYFIECPRCAQAMLAYADLVQVSATDYKFENPTLLWPPPEKYLDIRIHLSVRRSIEEARKCFKVGAYSACAVMCGKALEALCKEHGARKSRLVEQLEELKDRGVIDGRLYEWGDSLRDLRNVGAHEIEAEISKEDASDVLDFTLAICEYVYVLTDKYDAFITRKEQRKRDEPNT